MTESESSTLDNPLISVILATYNRAGFITEAVESVLRQTYQEFELIIVDDGSEDDTLSRLDRFRTDSRVRIITQENQGRAAAFNHALRLAKGSFIAVLDSDNRWLPNRLERGLDEFQSCPHADIVYGDCILINERGDEISRRNIRRQSGRITFALWRDNFVSINTALVRKSCFDALGGMDPARRRADDYELWLRFSTRFYFQYIPEYLAEYRVMEDQISSDKRGRFAANEAILRAFQAQYPGSMTPQQFSKGWAMFYARRARHFGAKGEYGEFFRSLVDALRHKFFFRAPWRALLAVLLKKRRAAH